MPRKNVIAPDGTFVDFGRKLSKAEKKHVKRGRTKHKVFMEKIKHMTQAMVDNDPYMREFLQGLTPEVPTLEVREPTVFDKPDATLADLYRRGT
jgi:hypothetical protein